MRLSITFLGLDLLSIDVTTDASSPAPEDDCSRDLSGGTTYATAIGFVSHMEKPHEVDVPDRDL